MSITLQIYQRNHAGQLRAVTNGAVLDGHALIFQITTQRRGTVVFQVFDPAGYQLESQTWPATPPGRDLILEYPLRQIPYSGWHSFKIQGPAGNTVMLNFYVLGELPEQPCWEVDYTLSTHGSPHTKGLLLYIAMPPEIAPRQHLQALYTSHPCRLVTDLAGNTWLCINPPRQCATLRFSYHLRLQTQGVRYSLPNVAGPNAPARYLRSEPAIESHHPRIVQLAQSIQARNPLQLVYQACSLVNSYLQYQLQPGEFGARYAVEQKIGDCTEYACLLAAILRARGIGARTVLGYCCEDGQAHAITEVYLAGCWLPLDVTNAQEPFMGLRPNFIAILRGNWMLPDTITKCVCYYYRTRSHSRVESQERIEIRPYRPPKVVLLDQPTPPPLPYQVPLPTRPLCLDLQLRSYPRHWRLEIVNPHNTMLRGRLQISWAGGVHQIIPMNLSPRTITSHQLKPRSRQVTTGLHCPTELSFISNADLLLGHVQTESTGVELQYAGQVQSAPLVSGS